jgi:nicotinamidase-related amidase
MKKALLVIDMQEVTVGAAHADFFKYDNELLNRVNSVIGSTDATVVVYIRNLMKNNFINKFAPVKVFDNTPEAELAKGLLLVSPYTFSKFTGDAFSVSDLCEFLKNNSIDTVELIGVDGGGCVSLTALGACENGYKVILNTSAIGTMFDSKKEKYFDKLKKLGAIFI